MRVLVIGGSGIVGRLAVPLLAEKHSVTVYDLHPPEAPPPGVSFVQGDVQDYFRLREAAEGHDAVLYMAMGQGKPWNRDPKESVPGHAAAFDVNVKGVYMALWAAADAGIGHAVYTSSMSVYTAVDNARNEKRYFIDEDLPPDARHVYGFTKRLGEEVCRNATRLYGMDVNALRLCFPIPDEKWYEDAREGEPTIRLAGSDLGRALLAALEFKGGFQAFTICGDYEQKLMRMDKARKLLGWEPLARPRQ